MSTTATIAVSATPCFHIRNSFKGEQRMAEQRSQSRAAIALAFVSGFLIFRCLWRVLIPGSEYAMPPWPLVSVISDILVMVALFIIKPMVPAATADSPALVRHATKLFIGGIIATAIMVLIRVSSDRGWWTGHLM